MTSLDDVSSLRDQIEKLQKELECVKEYETWWKIEQENLNHIIAKTTEDNKEFRQILIDAQDKRRAAGDSRRLSSDDVTAVAARDDEQNNVHLQRISELEVKLQSSQSEVRKIMRETFRQRMPRL
jgi:hypothetical protein